MRMVRRIPGAGLFLHAVASSFQVTFNGFYSRSSAWAVVSSPQSWRSWQAMAQSGDVVELRNRLPIRTWTLSPHAPTWNGSPSTCRFLFISLTTGAARGRT